MNLKRTVCALVPQSLLEFRRNLLDSYYISASVRRHKKALIKLRNKKSTIRVVFFVFLDATWKCDELYRLLERDPRFDPIILICPIVNFGKANMLKEMNRTYNVLSKRYKSIYKAYDLRENKFMKVKSELKPDLIFYTNPYEGLMSDSVYIKKFKDVLTAYVPYFFSLHSDYKLGYDQLLHNLVWRFYLETDESKSLACRYSRAKGRNTKVVGYPGVEDLMKNKSKSCYEWKIVESSHKRIIWAPHHTIEHNNQIELSTFLVYFNYMFEVAKKYEDKIQICFKPHPVLFSKLCLLWGEEETIKYYDRWRNLPNGMLHEDDYHDLFVSSDAIIHDCGSFITEYLYIGNPGLYLDNGKDYSLNFNSIAIRSLEYYYHASCREQIDDFILNVIKGNDPVKAKREEYVKSFLMPPNNQSACKNIYCDLLDELFN